MQQAGFMESSQLGRHARLTAGSIVRSRVRRGTRAALTLCMLALVELLLGAAPAGADEPMAVALRLGTTGIGLDYDFALGEHFSARVGYSGFQYDHSVDTSDVDYSGKFKLSMANAVLDWYVFNGGFRLSAGMVGNGTKLDVTGKPNANGSYTINNNVYSSGDVASLNGQLKFGNSVSPYVGLGWGKSVGTQQHLHFLVDLGAIYGGTPNVTLTAECGSGAPPGSALCTQLQSDVLAEKTKLQDDVTLVKWYPVLDFGLAYRF